MDLRLIEAWVEYATFEVVGHEQFRHPTQKFKAANMRSNPVGQSLRPRRLDVGVIRRPQHRKKDLCLPNLSRTRIDDRRGLPAVVHKEPFSRDMPLAKYYRQGFGVGTIMFTEGAVLIPIGMLLPVFLPEQLQSNAFAPHLLVNDRPIRLRSMRLRRRQRRKQETLQILFRQLWR